MQRKLESGLNGKTRRIRRDRATSFTLSTLIKFAYDFPDSKISPPRWLALLWHEGSAQLRLKTCAWMLDSVGWTGSD